MTEANRENVQGLLRRALEAIDTQITELQATRAALSVMTESRPASPTMKAEAPRKRRKFSSVSREKMRIAAKARWAKKKKAQVKKQQATPKGKKVVAKAMSVKAKPAKGKAVSTKKTASVKKKEAQPIAPPAAVEANA